MNERFTAIADAVSTGLGRWWFSVLSLVALALWIVYGAVVLANQIEGNWFTSQEWNFPLNTITTVGEWFIGALVAAAANRVEKRNRDINDQEMGLLVLIREHSESSARLHAATLALLGRIEGQEQATMQKLDVPDEPAQ